jgi:hypothetical protein
MWRRELAYPLAAAICDRGGSKWSRPSGLAKPDHRSCVVRFTTAPRSDREDLYVARQEGHEDAAYERSRCLIPLQHFIKSLDVPSGFFFVRVGHAFTAFLLESDLFVQGIARGHGFKCW